MHEQSPPSSTQASAGTAALTLAPTSPTATCPYCGVGCAIRAHVQDGQVQRVSADPEALPNLGMMCPKGALLSKVFDQKTRLTTASLRTTPSQPRRDVSPDVATQFIADRLTEISQQHGPGSLAWYGSGQLDTEASYLFTKLFKGYLGSNHTDTNSRLCMSSAVAGYKLSLGSDGPPTSYDDIPEADTFFILGANMAANHPVLFNMVRRRRATADHVRLIVVDPRKSKTAEFADTHLPVMPGGDVALLRLIAKRLVDAGQANTPFIKAHTTGHEAFIEQLAAYDESNLLAQAGVAEHLVDEAVEAFSQGRRTLSFYCMGANQSTQGTAKNRAIIDLHLLLGAIGRLGAGPFSLTGQPNAMGGREVGYLAHQLPGYRDVQNEAHRQEVESAWHLPRGAITPEPGLSAIPLFRAVADGNIKALWIACTNPVVSMPDSDLVKDALRQAELVIVQDISTLSETVEYADVVLPGAQWGEKTGTMTNSERLVTRSHRFLDPPGDAMPDWTWPARVAGAMGFANFGYENADQIWDEYRLLTAGRPCDQRGMTNGRLRAGPLRWPCVDTADPGTARRYMDHLFATPDGKARFSSDGPQPPDEVADHDYPMWLTTGRIASQWHTRTRTGLVPELASQEPEPFIEMHPEDAAAHDLEEGMWIGVESRRGRAAGRLRCRANIRQGLLFMPFHWGDRYDPSTNINRLTNPAYDPTSQQPELKLCAVRLVGQASPPRGGESA